MKSLPISDFILNYLCSGVFSIFVRFLEACRCRIYIRVQLYCTQSNVELHNLNKESRLQISHIINLNFLPKDLVGIVTLLCWRCSHYNS